MSGHSKWSTIKRQKGAADIKRGAAFTKLANAITVAVKLGGSGDAESNPRLRVVLEAARTANMPKDNVQRAIDRGLGKLPGQTIEEVTYEGFGPTVAGGKVAFLVEGVTDNRQRTTQEIKNIFERSGGSLGGVGSAVYMFDKVGEIKAVSKGASKEEEILELIDLGAKDVEDYLADGEQRYLVYTDVPVLNTINNKLTRANFKVDTAEIVYKPNITIEISDKEMARKVLEFTEKLEEHDDIQKVYANFDIPDSLIEEVSV